MGCTMGSVEYTDRWISHTVEHRRDSMRWLQAEIFLVGFAAFLVW